MPAQKSSRPDGATGVPGKEGQVDRTVASGGSWLSHISQLLGLYLVYVFISGWAFSDAYCRNFGLNPRWIDFSSYDILVGGFTVLFLGGSWLLPFYALAFSMPFLLDLSPWNKRAEVKIPLLLLLVAVLFPIYLLSHRAGNLQAEIDKGPKSRLPVITFSTANGRKHRGKLLFFKSATYFLRNVKSVDPPDPNETSDSLELSIFRAEELQEVKVVGYP